MNLTPMDAVLIVLAIVGIWAVVELALTLRRARAAVEEVARSANDTIEQVQPVIAKLDGAMDDLQPAVKQVDPLVTKVDGVVGEASASLEAARDILADVATVSGAAGVTDAVTSVASTAASAATGIVTRLAGTRPIPTAQIEGAPQPQGGGVHASGPAGGYVTYGEVKADTAAAAVDTSADGGVPDGRGPVGEERPRDTRPHKLGATCRRRSSPSAFPPRRTLRVPSG